MSFTFVPRTVKKPLPKQNTPTPLIDVSSQLESQRVDVKGKGKSPSNATITPEQQQQHASTSTSTSTSVLRKPEINERELCILLELALSEYALSTDAALYYKIKNSGGGYIPLSYILRHSPLLQTHLPAPVPPQFAIVKALANLAKGFESRIILSDPSLASWTVTSLSGTTSDASGGGYEIKKASWDVMREGGVLPGREWDECSIYVENIPSTSRGLAATVSCLQTLFEPLASSPSSSSTSLEEFIIQCITFPPRQKRYEEEELGDEKKSRGFAFLVLRDSELVQKVLEKWPWDLTPPTKRKKKKKKKRNGAEVETPSEETAAAQKSGFRSLGMPEWKKLKAEYLAYQTKLLEYIDSADSDNQLLTAPSPPTKVSEPARPPKHTIPPLAYASPHPPQGRTETTSERFPRGCLIFVRNIHSDTNKTTLRALLSTAFSSDQLGAKDAIDYVDYQKGMDTCHVRLSSATFGPLLCKYFASGPRYHQNGLDGVGIQLSGSPEGLEKKPTVVEIVDGKREELYWDKVPEKVRMAALRKIQDSGGVGTGGKGAEPEGGKWKRKRK